MAVAMAWSSGSVPIDVAMDSTLSTSDTLDTTATLPADVLHDVAGLLGLAEFDPAKVDPGTLATLTSRRNSPEETAARMRRYLHHIIDHPVSRLVDRRDLSGRLLLHRLLSKSWPLLRLLRP